MASVPAANKSANTKRDLMVDPLQTVHPLSISSADSAECTAPRKQLVQKIMSVGEEVMNGPWQPWERTWRPPHDLPGEQQEWMRRGREVMLYELHLLLTAETPGIPYNCESFRPQKGKTY